MKKKKKKTYLIKWKGYPLSEASQEPEENLNRFKLLVKFNKNKKKKKIKLTIITSRK